jgi:sulfur-oxidizing protein SoxX
VNRAALVLAMMPCAVVAAGDAQRGAAIAASRSSGLCVLCHAMPGVPAVQAGNLGPDLAGVGARLSREQLRERLLAPERANPDTVMPGYGPRGALARVAAARRDQPLLQPQQIDDVLAWLESLR